MKRFLDKYNAMTTTETKTEALQSFIKQMLTNRKKNDYAKKLENEHGVFWVNPQKVQKTPQRSRMVVLSGLAASLAILISSIMVFNLFNSNVELANQLIENDYFIHPGIEKGKTLPDSEMRILAITAYGHRNFKEAAQLFSSIKSKSADDQFFSALSFLYDEQYKESIEAFRVSNSVFREEVNWYLSLAYILSGDTEKALEILHKIKPREWNYLKAQKLLSEYK